MPGDPSRLRRIIQESLRVQRGSAEELEYIDTGNILPDISARQNHVVFARRGCGKTLLLRYSGRNLEKGIRAVYLNCEDYKRHSFPNVLIEILDALFDELEGHLSGWFGRKRRSKELIRNIRAQLSKMRNADDIVETSVKTVSAAEDSSSSSAGLATPQSTGLGMKVGRGHSRDETKKVFKSRKEKLKELDTWLPQLKKQVREFFELSKTVKAVYLQIDDLYHLRREDQPFIIDYVHRLCKDVPLFFKISTLRHASSLFVERDGQPIGAQERHDFQPIDIDYTFIDFRKLREQNKRISTNSAGWPDFEVQKLMAFSRAKVLTVSFLLGAAYRETRYHFF